MKRRQLASHATALGFLPSPRTHWFNPAVLALTAAKALLAKVFASYGDKREVQAVLASAPAPLTHRRPGDVWLDFAADLGDGFDATMTVASLLAASTLDVATADGGSLALPHGDVLVLGGDAVYPTASASAYENRTIGPFQATTTKDGDPRTLLAIPGNHDWYDGLTSYLRVFATHARIGAWQATQSRSYFVTALTPGWWLVGVDSQFGEYIDEPQLTYFRTNLTAKLADGDGVIVCTAAPGWVHTRTKGPDGFNQLHFFERTIVRTRTLPDGNSEPTGASVRLWLSGDSHHYSRYAQVSPDPSVDDTFAVQAVTCGLGGAYLAETHVLPDELELPPADSRMRNKDAPGMPMRRVGVTYPEVTTSRRLFRRVANPFTRWWLGWRNPGLLVGMGWVHLGLVWLLGAIVALVQPSSDAIGPVLRGPLATTAITLATVVGAALVAWCVHALASRLFGWGGVVTSLAIVLQLIAGCLTLLALVSVARVVRAVGVPEPPPIILLVIAAALTWGIGALVGTLMFGMFMLTQRRGPVGFWSMAAQAIEDHKGFLRLRLRPDGELELYAIVVDTICRDWTTTQTPTGGTGIVPTAPITGVRLLDGPVHIARPIRSETIRRHPNAERPGDTRAAPHRDRAADRA